MKPDREPYLVHHYNKKYFVVYTGAKDDDGRRFFYGIADVTEQEAKKAAYDYAHELNPGAEISMYIPNRG